MASSNNPNNENLDGVQGRPATPEEIAQRDGYIRGRNDENYVQRNMREQEQVIAQSRANDSAASGMVFGFVIALLAAGAGAAFFFLGGMGDRNDVAPVAAPQIEKEKIIEKETTIIEKQAPAPAVSTPDVQIDVPEIEVPDIDVTKEAEPAAEQPAAEPATEQPAPAEPE